MVLKKTIILSIKITQSTKKDIIKYLEAYLKQPRSTVPLTVFTPNPEQIVVAMEDKAFSQLLNSADVALPDGAGLIWASKQLSAKVDQLSQKISGIDLMEDLTQSVAALGYPVGFLGGRNGVAQAALEYLQKKYPRLRGWAQDGPEMTVKSNSKTTAYHLSFTQQRTDIEDFFDNLVKRVIESGTRLVFVGLGAPKQELFISELKRQLTISSFQSPIVLMSVGGAFDMLAGRLARAPGKIRQIQLEWLWRLLLEPQRIVRQARLIKFLLHIFMAKYGKM